MNVHYSGWVTASEIKQAPNVRLQSKINVKCKERQTEELNCCVQSPYKVKWFRDTTELLSSKS